MQDTVDFINNSHLEILKQVNENRDFYYENVKNYLIQWTKENNKKFNWRLEVSYYFNFVEPTVNGLNNILFRKPITFENISDSILQNVTVNNKSLKFFMRQIAKNAIRDGFTIITQNSNKEDGYLENYEANQVINYRYDNYNLIQITLRDTYYKPNGEFSDTLMERFKVIKLGGGQIWERELVSNGQLELVDSWENTLDFIPVTILYLGDFISNLNCKSVVRKIVKLNKSHYNLKSGVMNICHIASNPVPKIFGEIKNNGLTIGVNEPLIFEDKESSDFKWEEINGQSVKIAIDEIKEIEEYIYKQSFSILKEEPYQTATQARIENNKGKGILNSFAESIESAIIKSLNNLDLVMGRKLSNSIVSINKDFDDILIDSVAIANIINMQKSGQVSLETLWNMLKRGEILNETFDADLEKQRLENEALQGL